jgi:hypothetical protein
MSEQRADATDLPHGSFAEGQADPDDNPEDERLGRFSDGQAQRATPRRGRRLVQAWAS